MTTNNPTNTINNLRSAISSLQAARNGYAEGTLQWRRIDKAIEQAEKAIDGVQR